MANWQREIDISEEWAQTGTSEARLPALCASIACAIRSLLETKPYPQEFSHLNAMMQVLADDFSELAHDAPTLFQFDIVMNRLYDLGDTSLDGRFAGKKACWINTIKARPK